MDFTWITNDVGDITAVTVSSPLTGGGTSGSVSVGILSGTTSNLGAVQLSDSTSSTSTTLAATANSVKTSYDLAAAAIPKSTVTTAGDVIYATGSGAVTRLGIGTAGQVLKVNSGATAPEWGTASGGKVLQVVFGSTAVSASTTSTTYADTNLTATITPTLNTSKILVLVSQNGVLGTTASNGVKLRLLRAGSSIFEFAGSLGFTQASSTRNDVAGSCSYLDAPATTSATTYKTQFAQRTADGTACQVQVVSESQSTITLIEIGA
jgi:hypothetical protein